MTLQQLFRLARAFTDMGWSVQEQLSQAIDGDMYELNPNAVRSMATWLRAAERAGVEEAGDLADELEENYAGEL